MRRSFSRASRVSRPAFFSTPRGVGVERDERAGDAETDRAGLAAHAAAVERGVDVVDLFGLREPQRLLRDDLVREDREVRRERAAVHDDLAGARAQPHPRDRLLAAAGGLDEGLAHEWSFVHAMRALERAGSGRTDGLLRLVRMSRARVHLQLPQHLAAERTLRQHAAHREPHDLLGVAREQVLEALAADPARVAGVAVVRLLQLLARVDRELRRVHDDDVVAGVEVRRPDRLVLAAQQRGDLGREAAEDRAVGVDHVPLAG